MDINMIRLMTEINSIKTFGAVRSMSEGTSMFSELLQSFLESTPSPVSKSVVPMPIQPATHVPNITTLQETDRTYSDLIQEAASQYDVPAKLIQSVIHQESGFNPTAKSGAGALGLMQLMPGTAQFLGVADAFDPKQNIFGGTKYLRQLLDQFDGNLETALAAYNAGPGNVRKYGGIPPFQETQNYVKKVMDSFLS